MLWLLLKQASLFNFHHQFSHYLNSIYFKFQVSLDSRVREIINRNMIAPSQHTFDEAQLQIYTLMHRDSYPRFVNSPTYKNMLRTVGVEPPESSASS
jgi:regulator of G-protein signaling